MIVGTQIFLRFSLSVSIYFLQQPRTGRRRRPSFLTIKITQGFHGELPSYMSRLAFYAYLTPRSVLDTYLQPLYVTVPLDCRSTCNQSLSAYKVAHNRQKLHGHAKLCGYLPIEGWRNYWAECLGGVLMVVLVTLAWLVSFLSQLPTEGSG